MNDCVRLPIAAGTFYPARTAQLRQQLDDCLGDLGQAADTPLTQSVGLISPHAGFLYSGKVAGAGFRAIAQQGRPDVVIILGASHSGLDPWLALSPHSAWATPLGQSPVDQTASTLLQGSEFTRSAAPFTREHSIEVQLPFIQHVWGVDTPIVPVCVRPNDLLSIQDAAKGLATAVQGRKALIVASSDFTHYRPAQEAHGLDGLALDRIVALDEAGFDHFCRSKDVTICGVGAIELLILVAHELQMSEARVVSYATSGDATGDTSSVVGYASVVISYRNERVGS